MNIKGINHVGVVVRDIQEAVSFYKDAFGASLPPIKRREDLGVDVAFVNVGESELELFSPLEQPPAGSIGEGMKEFLKTRGEGIHHLAFTVVGIETALQELKDKGLKLIDEVPRKGMHGKIAFISEESGYGIRTELTEP